MVSNTTQLSDTVYVQLIETSETFGERIFEPAMIVAIIALAVTFWQARISRRHNRLSVKPRLNLSTYLSEDKIPIRIVIKNNGLGPAVNTRFKYLYGNKFYKSLKEPLFEKFDFGNHILVKSGGIGQGTIKCGEEEEILKIEIDDEKKNHRGFALTIEAFLKEVSITINTESLYKEKQEYHFEFKNPSKF